MFYQRVGYDNIYLLQNHTAISRCCRKVCSAKKVIERARRLERESYKVLVQKNAKKSSIRAAALHL
jgi:hypothetical protein